MQYNININQKQLVELANELDVKINLKTATVLNYFKEAHTVFKQKTINGDVWYQINYDKVLEQNPLLDVEPKQIARYFKHLVDLDILSITVEKGFGTITWYKPSTNYIRCFFETRQDKKVPSDSTKKFYPTEQKSSVRQDKKVLSYIEHNNNKHINNNILDKKIENFINNPNYPRWKTTNYPNLTDEDIKTNLEIYLSDYPDSKITSFNNYLTGLNRQKGYKTKIKTKQMNGLTEAEMKDKFKNATITL